LTNKIISSMPIANCPPCEVEYQDPPAVWVHCHRCKQLAAWTVRSLRVRPFYMCLV